MKMYAGLNGFDTFTVSLQIFKFETTFFGKEERPKLIGIKIFEFITL